MYHSPSRGQKGIVPTVQVYHVCLIVNGIETHIPQCLESLSGSDLWGGDWRFNFLHWWNPKHVPQQCFPSYPDKKKRKLSTLLMRICWLAEYPPEGWGCISMHSLTFVFSIYYLSFFWGREGMWMFGLLYWGIVKIFLFGQSEYDTHIILWQVICIINNWYLCPMTAKQTVFTENSFKIFAVPMHTNCGLSCCQMLLLSRLSSMPHALGKAHLKVEL